MKLFYTKLVKNEEGEFKNMINMFETSDEIGQLFLELWKARKERKWTENCRLKLEYIKNNHNFLFGNDLLPIYITFVSLDWNIVQQWIKDN